MVLFGGPPGRLPPIAKFRMMKLRWPLSMLMFAHESPSSEMSPFLKTKKTHPLSRQTFLLWKVDGVCMLIRFAVIEIIRHSSGSRA